jgi:steroid 5-alpha reductase family enzyme
MVSSLIIAVLLFVHSFFLIALVRKNFSVIDVGWGPGIVLATLVAYLHYPLSLRNAVVLLAVTAWGLRLALYIYKRGLGKGEDPRYNKYRRLWAPRENLQAYFKVFLFQGCLMLVVSLPATAGMTVEAKELSLLNWTGLGIFLAGFGFEVSSDGYLKRWKSRPENRGKICTTGPWRLCRFPNYFGEVLLWYGIYLLAFTPATAWTILGPLAINVLILKVTGVPPLEERYRDRPEYQAYAAVVPRFVPFTKA